MAPTEVSPAIEFRSTAKFYRETRGIEDVSLFVNFGEVLGLLGPNGAGKTTAIRVILGLIRPTSGNVLLNGIDISQAKDDVRSNIGYLPGTLALYEYMTGRDFLIFMSRLRKKECAIEIDQLSQRFNFDPSKKIHDLSRGNKQKLGVIQAFMHSPSILVLDEPTSGLDPLMQKEFENLVNEVKAEGAAILLSSHVMSEVENLADRAAILDHGRVLACQTMTELRSRAVRTLELDFPTEVPTSVFASLLGVTNVDRKDNVIFCRVVGDESEVLRVSVQHGLRRVRSNEPNLEEAFLSIVEDNSTSNNFDSDHHA